MAGFRLVWCCYYVFVRVRSRGRLWFDVYWILSGTMNQVMILGLVMSGAGNVNLLWCELNGVCFSRR